MVDVTATLNTLLGNLIKKLNTLLDCPIRFSGHYGGQHIQQFIEYVETYKNIKGIPDNQALQELGHLLTENAYTWWLRRRCHFSTWSEAKSALQNQYSKQRAVYLIYKDVFSHPYDEYKSDEDFINDKYELLNELPDPKPSERHKLDMIFALLPCDKQAQVEYANISSILDLKEHMKKLENIAKQNGIALMELQENLALKQQINGIVQIVVNGQHQQQQPSAEKPTEVHINNDKDPLIKVRRTEDLMPQVKEEENEQDTIHEQDEFISTANDITRSNESASNNFQIDTDLMNQINNIIDESEMHCEAGSDNVKISSVMSDRESSPTTIAYLIKSKVESSNYDINGVKKKIRCSFCRNFGHIAQACLKRPQHKNIFAEKFNPDDNLIRVIKPGSQKDNELAVTSSNNNSNNNNSDTKNSSHLIPDTTNKTLVNNAPVQETNPTLSTTQHYPITSTVPTVSAVFSLNTSLPYVRPPFSHTTTLTTQTPSTNHATALTTKLITPINGPGSNKQISFKLRSITSPSPKCHQCGNVGFYKSICPNCSPIYNSNKS